MKKFPFCIKEIRERWEIFRAEIKTQWLLWLLIFTGILFFAWVYKLFDLRALGIIFAIILAGIAYSMSVKSFIAILAIIFTVTNIVTQIKQFQISNNAILLFNTPLMNEEKKGINLPMSNLGNTMATDFKFGAVLVKALSDEEKIKAKKNFEIYPLMVNPGIELYPKETTSLPMPYPGDNFQSPGIYFMICYLKYKTFSNEDKECERWFQYENKRWFLLGRNQEGLEKYKAELEATSQLLRKTVINNKIINN